MNYTIREIKDSDFPQLMELYTHLHEKDVPEMDERVSAVWEGILSDKNHHIIVAETEGKVISSCVCVIIPNLTRNQRPYAFVENVVTHADYRGKGIATACLDYAREIAKKENCYKLMLLTGSKDENTLNFYRRAGYNSEDKTAFIQWLE
ncbi:MAG: GNAT family N-acetyltransferase [Ruminococcus sp.]|nr:GNAT family N-acetyltransferase [Ruminococcus sp.]